MAACHGGLDTMTCSRLPIPKPKIGEVVIYVEPEIENPIYRKRFALVSLVMTQPIPEIRICMVKPGNGDPMLRPCVPHRTNQRKGIGYWIWPEEE